MPFITVKVLEGKTQDQKRQLVKKMTQVASETLNVGEDRVFVFIEDLQPENYGKQGTLSSDLE